MDLDDGITLRAADDPTIKNELRRAWIADRLDERLGEFGETHAVDVVCATWNANGKDVTKLNLDLEPWLRSRGLLTCSRRSRTHITTSSSTCWRCCAMSSRSRGRRRRRRASRPSRATRFYLMASPTRARTSSPRCSFY